MNDLRLNYKDGWFITVCLIILVAGVWIGSTYFYQAFPEASITFRYDREGSGKIAQDFWKTVGYAPPSSFYQFGRFGYDGNAKTYLEKELGLEKAQKYFGHPIKLWYWQHRWFLPSTKEEFRVFVTPEGDVVRLLHMVEENAPGASLSEDSARTIAQQFLFGSMHQDSGKLTYIESQKTGRPHRSDWTFTYRATGIEPVKGSEYRYRVGLIGDKIGSYEEFLKVPEAWTASYNRLRSYNETAGQVDGVWFVLTMVAIVAIFILRAKKRDIKWRTALWFGGVAMALNLLNEINDLPLILYGYDTTSSWSGFLTQEILMSIVSAIGSGGSIFILTAAAETLYRERYGNQMALSSMFTPRALRTKSAFKNILLGITLTSFFFAYQIVFYLVADKFGAWSPSEVPYDNLLNTWMPWLAVLAIGFFPAVTEEFMSRMFSIPFLQKAFKSRLTWLAVLLPAFIWGFGHAGYPNQPFYIRGLEVGLAGIIIGVVMLRWGILACLVWHYTVDALYTAMLLFRSENVYFIFTAAVATGLLVIPLVLAFIAYIRRGSFLPDAGCLNSDSVTTAIIAEDAAVPDKSTPPPKLDVPAYRPLPVSRKMIALGLLVAGVLTLLIPVEKLGDFIGYPVSTEAAIKTVADSLRSAGLANPDTLRLAAFVREQRGFEPDEDMIYLLKHAGSVSALNSIADQRLGTGRWRVNAWVPENRLRFFGTVHGKTGKIESIIPWLPEEMPGDSLSKDSARGLVEHVLTARGEDLSKFEMKDYKLWSRPKRLDHFFAYEAKDGDPRHVGEAKFRRNGLVDGHYLEVNGRPFYKIPETWQREREATTALRTVRYAFTYLAYGALAVWLVIMFVFQTRKGLIPWKQALVWAIVPTAIALLSQINSFYTAQEEYFKNVETPLGVFTTANVAIIAISVVLYYFMFVLGTAMLRSLFAEQIAGLKREVRRSSLWDACLVMLATIGVLLIVRSAEAWLGAWNPSWIPFSGWGVPGWLAEPFPVASMMKDSVSQILFASVLIGSAVLLWNGLMRRPCLRAVLILAFIAMFLKGIEPEEWLFSLLSRGLMVLLVWFILHYVISGRAVLFVAAIVAATVFTHAAEGFGTENCALMVQTWIFVGVAILGLAWWLGLFHKRQMKVD